MKEIAIRPAKTDEEFQWVTEMRQYAFYPSPGSNQRMEQNRPYFRGDHEFIVYKQDEPVATAAAIPMTQNIRGKIVTMSGIGGVATYPEFRRQGYVDKLMKYIFDEITAKDQVTSTLYPFKESFYGRYGYITLPQAKIATFDPNRLKSILSIELDVTYRRYRLNENVEKVIKLFRRYQKKTHGMGLFSDDILQYMENQDRWVVEMYDDNDLLGFFFYEMKGFRKPLDIKRLFISSAKGRYAALQYLALHIDQVSEVKLAIPADSTPEVWWYNITPTISSREWIPSAMGRVCDIEGLDGMTGGTQDVLHLSITDEYFHENSACWVFDSGSTISVDKCKDDNSHDQISMNIRALSALVFGSYHPDMFEYLGWAELGPEQIDRLSEMFPMIGADLYQLF